MSTVGRPPNIENKTEIAQAAFNLFAIKGYKKTTYLDIAKAIGKDRAIVQHYYPKKELFIVDFLNKLMLSTEEYIHLNSLKAKNDYATLYVVGQIYFAFLLMNDGIKEFTFDIISDRRNTVNSLLFNLDWVFTFLHVDQQFKHDVSDNFFMTMGGAYELIYKYILDKEEIYLPRFLERIIISFVAGLNYDSHEVAKTLPKYALNKSEIEKATQWLSKILLNV